jgi:acetyl/propionyl-CoA carboxylase alpha subunit
MRRQVFFLRSGGREGPEELAVERRGSRCRVTRTDGVEEFDAALLPDGRISILFGDGRQFCGRGIPRGGDGVDVVSGGRARRVSLTRTRQERTVRLGNLDAAGGVEEIRALMHGRIVEVRVAPGDRVEAGALLLVLEAMKMQNEIRASRGGVVERAEVSAGQTVEGGALLLTLTAEVIQAKIRIQEL